MKAKVIYIGNRLSKKGRTSTTIDTLSSLLILEGYKVKTASAKSSKLIRLWDMSRMVVSNKNWADYVLIDTYSTLNFWYAIIIARLCQFLGLQYIPILHGGKLPRRLETHPKVIKEFLNNAHQVVSPGDYLKFAFAKAGFPQIQVIPNSIELKNYPFKQREVLEPKLLWVRSFAEIYHPVMALELMEQLQQQYPAAQLTMVGPDKDGSKAACKKLAKEKDLNVIFTGLLSKQKWTHMAADFDIFINTSRFDNMPVSVLEAMALGLPVVSTNVGGIPFLIEDYKNGLLVASEDSVDMYEKIKMLLNDKQLVKNLSFNSRNFVENYDWEKVKVLWNKLI